VSIVHLARHGSHAEVGHVLSGRSEIGLSAKGREEAGWLAERLAGSEITAIYSSPRRRALETAGVVAARLGVDVQIVAALDEIDFGEWVGQSFEALEGDARWRMWNQHRASAAAPGGEAMAVAIERARSFLTTIAEGEALCVSHCDIIRGVVANYIGLHLDHLLAFDCDPASLTTLELWPGGGRLVSLNERPHQPA
jgi:ribonuclease H / adenosylcobalamin/alpha-ribazole phosphatase